MGTIFTLAAKDLKLLLRDKASLFWVLFFPLLVALFFGTIFSGTGGSVSGIKIAVIDEDGGDYAKAYLEELKTVNALRVYEMPKDSAIDKVRQGKMSAYLIMKKGFSETMGMFTDEPKIEIGIDPARKMTAGYLQGLLTRSQFTLLHKRYANIDTWRGDITELQSDVDSWDIEEGTKSVAKDILGSLETLSYNIEEEYLTKSDPSDTTTSDTTAASDNGGFNLFPIEMSAVTNDDAGPRSSFEITFPSSLLWALIAISASFAVSIVRERTAGTYLRLRLAPISRAKILAGKGMAAFLASTSICVLLLALGAVVFGVRITNPVVLSIGIVSSALCFVGLSMLISVIGKTEEAVGGASWGILLVAAMTGGGMIPLMFMPSWLVTISHFSPVKWGILAIEGGVWRNFGYGEMMLPVGMLLGIGLVSFIIGVTILKKRDA